MADHYETLGVPRDADADAIKRAYRSKASAAHPDREGGSHEAMTALNRALEVLGNPEKRSRYDKTGDDGSAPDIERMARDGLVQLLLSFIDADFEVAGDVIEGMRGAVRDEISTETAAIQRGESKLKALERRKKRIKGPPVFASLVDAKMRKQRHENALAAERIRVHNRVLELLADFSDAGGGDLNIDALSVAGFGAGRGSFTIRTFR